MARHNYDPTKVRLFPEYPAKQLQAVWERVVMEILDEFPRLSAVQRGSIALRRLQEGLTSPSR